VEGAEIERFKGLILRAKNADKDAFGELFKAYEGAVYEMALRITGDRASAEDARQEAFVRAFQAMARFDAERPFGPWILRITANCARDKWRQRPCIPLDESHEALPDGEVSEDKEDIARLNEALKRLSPLDRSVLSMRYEGELHAAEIAKELGIQEGAVRVRLLRARERLLKLMGGEP
jgi:RNA polymerase sigma-70 factor (ECF subfamily)